MKTYKIAILPWDWIWPEVCDEAVKVLDAIWEKFWINFKTEFWYIGGAWYEKYGEHFPEVTKKIVDNSDAVLFGSVGWPVDKQMEEKWNDCEKKSILGIRKHLGLVVNIRPARIWSELSHISVLKEEKIPENWLNIITFRELSGGLYFGEHTTYVENWIRKARDVCEYDENIIRYISEFCFKSASKSGKKIAVVDKANVLDTSRLWRTIVDEVAVDYPEVEFEYILVDSCAMHLVQKPENFEYILTENLFGDILSDLTSTFSGSLGLLASASFSKTNFGLYEPSGGSAPDIAGKGIANPIAQILCVGMMLRHSFWMEEAAKSIEKAVDKTISDWFRTGDIYRKMEWEKLVGTKEIGEEIIKRIK